ELYGKGVSISTLPFSRGFTNAGTLSVQAGKEVTIHGNYSQTETGVFKVGVNGANFGKLNVVGNATFVDNGKIAVDVTPNKTIKVGNLGTILQVTGGVLTIGEREYDDYMLYADLQEDGKLSVSDNSALWDFTAKRSAQELPDGEIYAFDMSRPEAA